MATAKLSKSRKRQTRKKKRKSWAIQVIASTKMIEKNSMYFMKTYKLRISYGPVLSADIYKFEKKLNRYLLIEAKISQCPTTE
jgi:hypothetical protein